MWQKLIYALISMLVVVRAEAQNNRRAMDVKWSQLTALPDAYGFAGSFAGVSNHCLIVAGGANFPDGGAPWTGSKKVWTDKIFVLENPDGQWKEAGKLPIPIGYGASVVWRDQLICFGGSNANGHSKEVISIGYRNGKIEIGKLPQMPATLANSAGALIGNTVYIAGGLEKPDDKRAGTNFWRIDLSEPAGKQNWQILESWPGPDRMLSVAGTANGCFYLFSGASLYDDKGNAKRRYLQDAYQYNPNHGWKKIADLPYATVAAASPAYTTHNNNLLIFGGDDGTLADKAAELKDKHPGFSDQVLSYDPVKDHWFKAARIATEKNTDADTHPNNSVWAPVTTSSVIWNGYFVIPGGEVRPAVRTPRVLKAVIH